MASQVNITLLDINDNHPTWKDAPYYINLVEMTPPDSDVTTVSGGGGAELPGGCSRSVCLSLWASQCGAVSESALGAEFRMFSCMVKDNQSWGKALTQCLETAGSRLCQKEHWQPKDSAQGARAGSARGHPYPGTPGLWPPPQESPPNLP